jgi:hypothetical protein
MRSSGGQSTVEVIGLLPLLLAVGLGVLSLLSAGAAEQAAGGAAEAGAVALLQGRDGRAAARAALDDWPERRTHVVVRGSRVTVRVTPRGPLGARLTAEVSADAGDVASAAGAGARAAQSSPSGQPGARSSAEGRGRPSAGSSAGGRR